MAVGAILADDPGNDDIETFNDQGPVEIYHPSTARERRQKRDITAIDGGAITGAGGFPILSLARHLPPLTRPASPPWGDASRA